MASATTQFSSEGFDLDALQDAADNVVLELSHDGKSQKVTAPDEQQPTSAADDEKKEANDIMATAEDYKQQGNQAFGKGDFDAAYKHYSAAIEATPGHPTGPELLQLQEEWQMEQNGKARRRLQQQDEERRRKSKAAESNNEQQSTFQQESEPEEETFQPPRHAHHQKLAIYYNNRAAAAMQQHQNDQQKADNDANNDAPDGDDDDDNNDSKDSSKLHDALQDCNIAILLDETYGKAWLRRATIHERLSKTDLALRDAKKALELAISSNNSPTAAKIRPTVARLQKLEDERLEQLKTETMDKLKDLGNSILGNFGLSLNNFSAQQDPNTGSYSISFNQNK